jgi:hypothetical protein
VEVIVGRARKDVPKDVLKSRVDHGTGLQLRMTVMMRWLRRLSRRMRSTHIWSRS